MYLFAVIIIVIFAIFGIIIGAQNFSTLVTVNILRKQIIDVPLTFVIIYSVAAGIILAFILAIIDQIRLKAMISRHKRTIDELRAELGSLKTIPAEEETEEI